MKKPLFLFILFFFGCSLSLKNIPQRPNLFEASGEIRITSPNREYEGPLTLKIEYPDRITFLLFGPFGETEIYLKKDGEKFLFLSNDEKIEEEREFEERFGISLKDLIETLLEKTLKLEKKAFCFKRDSTEICVKFTEIFYERS